MRDVVVNGRCLGRRVTGVERFASEVLALSDESFRIERPGRVLNGFAGHLWEQLVLSRRVPSGSVLWSPANTGPLLVTNQVLTLHDLGPLEHPEWFQRSFAIWYRLFWPILIRQVRRIIVPSAYVRRQVLQRFPAADVRVVPGGLKHETFHPASGDRLPGLPEKYILFVGSLEPRKNLAGLLQAWEKIHEDQPETWLVIAGTGGHVYSRVNLSAEIRQVCWLGYVPDAHLPALYRHATLLVLPSLSEGFGLTVLEAMACGTPVLVSDGGALPELVLEAGMVFKLSNPAGLQESLRTCLTEPDLLAGLRQSGLARAADFSWARTAEAIRKELNAI